MDFDKIVGAYTNLREARSKLRKEYDTQDATLKDGLTRLENVLLGHLNDTGTESVRTSSGTFYRQVKVKPSGSDWKAFYDWIKAEDAFDALEQRIKATFIKQFMDEHDGTLPPGVSVHREYEVRVRKSS